MKTFWRIFTIGLGVWFGMKVINPTLGRVLQPLVNAVVRPIQNALPSGN
jgi:hypothetical protein